MPDLTAQFATEDGRDDLPDLMRRAVTVIETRGWLQGDFFDLETAFVRKVPIEECAVCVRGALNVAAGFDPTGPEMSADAREDAVDALAFHLGYEEAEDGDEGTAWFLTTWNDDGERGKDEVLTALRECAAELEVSTR